MSRSKLKESVQVINIDACGDIDVGEVRQMLESCAMGHVQVVKQYNQPMGE